jgi:rubrerythrin
MPGIVHPFAVLAADRKVTNEELVRAIRFAIASEYEAVQLYTQLAESTDNRLAQEVLKSVAEEEIIHAGEFLGLLKELAPNEAALYARGEAEVGAVAAALAGENQVTGSAGETSVTQVESIASEPEVTTNSAEETQPKEEENDTELTVPLPEETQNPSPRRIGNLFEKP